MMLHTLPPTDSLADALPTSDAPPLSKLLSPAEEHEFALCEQLIERGLETWLEVGIAVCVVRDRRLYRAKFATFELWAQAKMGVTASRLRQLCGASEVVQHLLEEQKRYPGNAFVIPASETLVRPLAGLAPEDQLAAWNKAVSLAPNGRPTRSLVQAVAREWKSDTTNLEPLNLEPRTLNGEKREKVREAELVGPKRMRLMEASDRAIASTRELVDLAGTADSSEAAGLLVSLEQLQKYKDHLADLERMHSARI